MIPKKLYEIRKKMLGTKLFNSRRYRNLNSDLFLIGLVVFVLIVKSIIKNEKFHLKQICAGYEKILQKQNCSSQKYLQIFYLLFYHRSYIFSFIYRTKFSKNFVSMIKKIIEYEKFHFTPNLFGIRKNF